MTLTKHRREKSATKTRSSARPSAQQETERQGVRPGTAIERIRRTRLSPTSAELLQLQREIGNRAVGRMVARSVRRQQEAGEERQQEAGEETEEPMQCGPAPPQLVPLAKALIAYGKDHNKPAWVKDMSEFLETGELPVRSLHANIMRQPQFLGRAVARLKRGYMVRVLYKRGPWLRVEYQAKEGWIHRNRLFPIIIRLRPGATGSGTTRGEAEIGGRG